MQVLKESVKKAILSGAIQEFFDNGYQMPTCAASLTVLILL